MCGFCNVCLCMWFVMCVCVCVCVGFLMCGFVYVCILYCVVVCMCGFCNVWVCVCVSGGGGGVFCQLCGCFGNICTCIYCVFVFFPLCMFILIRFSCASARTTATE